MEKTRRIFFEWEIGKKAGKKNIMKTYLVDYIAGHFVSLCFAFFHTVYFYFRFPLFPHESNSLVDPRVVSISSGLSVCIALFRVRFKTVLLSKKFCGKRRALSVFHQAGSARRRRRRRFHATHTHTHTHVCIAVEHVCTRSPFDALPLSVSLLTVLPT